MYRILRKITFLSWAILFFQVRCTLSPLIFFLIFFVIVFPFDRILLRNYTQEFGEPKVTVEGYIDSLNGRRLSIFNVHLKAGTKVLPLLPFFPFV